MLEKIRNMKTNLGVMTDIAAEKIRENNVGRRSIDEIVSR